MITVYKCPVEIKLGEAFPIELPRGARILDVNVQNGSAYMWALVDTSRAPDPRIFRIYGTGHEIECTDIYEARMRYVATFHQKPFVWHLFQENIWKDQYHEMPGANPGLSHT